MKYIHALIALAIATLLTATFTFAHDEESIDVKHDVKIMVMSGSEPIEIDGSDLEVGESQQFFTDSGKEVLISRDEDGYNVTVDGKEILTGSGHHFKTIHSEAIHGAHSKVFVQRLGDGEEKDIKFIGTDGTVDVLVDSDVEWHEAGGDHKVMVMSLGDAKSPAQHLLDSGVLDKVDEATREEILEVLRDAAPHHHVGAHRIVIEKKDDDDEGDGDEH